MRLETIRYQRTINVHPRQVCTWDVRRIILGEECVLATYIYTDGSTATKLISKKAIVVLDYLKYNRLKYEDLPFVTPKGILKDSGIFRSTAEYMGVKGIAPDTMVLVFRYTDEDVTYNKYSVALEHSEEAQNAFELEQVNLEDLDDLYTNELSY